MISEHPVDDVEGLIAFWANNAVAHPSLGQAAPESLHDKFDLAAGVTSVMSARNDPDEVVGVNTMRIVDNGRAAPIGAVFGSNLLVHRSFRGGSLAGQLMEQVFTRAVLLGYDRLLALVNPRNETAFRLYRYFGFRPVHAAVAECNDIVLESHWPMVARFLANGVGPDLPNWPDPSWQRLMTGFRPRHRQRESRGDAEATTRQPDLVEYETVLPAWHRPTLVVVVESWSGRIVGVRGDFLDLLEVDGRRRVTNHAPAGMRIVATTSTGLVVDEWLEPGASLDAGPIPGDGQSWVVEAHAEEGPRLCRCELAATSPSPEELPDQVIESGRLGLRLCRRTGVITVLDRRDGREVLRLGWPDVGEFANPTPREPVETDVDVVEQSDGALEVSALADRWSGRFEAAGRPITSGRLDGVRVAQIIRPVEEGVDIEVAVDVALDVQPGTDAAPVPLRCDHWWTLGDGVLQTAAATWAFTPHSLAEDVAARVLPARALPPPIAEQSDGWQVARSGDLELRLEWEAPDSVATAKWAGRTLPSLQLPIDLEPGRRTVLRRRLRVGEPAAPRCTVRVEAGEVVELRHAGHPWVRRFAAPEPLGPAIRSWGGITPLVAAGPWSWSVDGGVDPERWQPAPVPPMPSDGGLHRLRWIDPNRSELVEAIDAEVEVVDDDTVRLVVSAVRGPAAPAWWSVGLGIVVEPPGPGTIAVDTPLGPVEVPTTSSSGRVRLAGRHRAAVHTDLGSLTAITDPEASIAAWPLEGSGGRVSCPIMITRRVPTASIEPVVVTWRWASA